MQLFFAKDTVARVSLIVLEEIGASYEAVRVDFGVGGQRQAAYLAVNPKGRVPALVTGEGVLTETPAILSYLAARFAPARLMPEALFAAAQVQEVCAYLCSTVHVAHAHRVRGARWSDDPAVIAGLRVKVAQNMAAHFAYLERRFIGPWVMGAAYSVVDPYLFVVAGWLASDGVDIAAFPQIAAHHATMLARPAVQRALAQEG